MHPTLEGYHDPTVTGLLQITLANFHVFREKARS